MADTDALMAYFSEAGGPGPSQRGRIADVSLRSGDRRLDRLAWYDPEVRVEREDDCYSAYDSGQRMIGRRRSVAAWVRVSCSVRLIMAWWSSEADEAAVRDLVADSDSEVILDVFDRGDRLTCLVDRIERTPFGSAGPRSGLAVTVDLVATGPFTVYDIDPHTGRGTQWDGTPGVGESISVGVVED